MEMVRRILNMMADQRELSISMPIFVPPPARKLTVLSYRADGSLRFARIMHPKCCCNG